MEVRPKVLALDLQGFQVVSLETQWLLLGFSWPSEMRVYLRITYNTGLLKIVQGSKSYECKSTERIIVLGDFRI